MHNTISRQNESRCVYIAEFSDNHVYVGTTSNYEQRVSEHLFGGDRSQVFQHKRHTGLIPSFSKITDYIPAHDADVMEMDKAVYYACIGKKVLNVMRPGGYCGLKKKEKPKTVSPKETKHKERQVKPDFELPEFIFDESELLVKENKSVQVFKEQNYIPRFFLHMENDWDIYNLRIILCIFDLLYKRDKNYLVFTQEECNSGTVTVDIRYKDTYTKSSHYDSLRKSATTLNKLKFKLLPNRKAFKICKAKINKEGNLCEEISFFNAFMRISLNVELFSFTNTRDDYICYDRNIMKYMVKGKYLPKLYIATCLLLQEKGYEKTYTYRIDYIKEKLNINVIYPENTDFLKRVIDPYVNTIKELYDKGLLDFYIESKRIRVSHKIGEISFIAHKNSTNTPV